MGASLFLSIAIRLVFTAVLFTIIFVAYEAPNPPQAAVRTTVHNNESTSSASVVTENLVDANDKIITDRFRSPIVLEEFKLIFFDVPKVACSAWKLMFHRMIGEPMGDDYYYDDLYDPDRNKLTYLRDYNLTYASEIMQDPTWTRAIFVRNPHERYLSAYLDKGLSHHANYVHQQCCPHHRNCFDAPNNTFSDWVELTASPPHCEDGHWQPYTHRIDAKYWQYMNFVGQMEPDTLQRDAKALLEKVGAWDKFGAHGWGDDGTSAFFDSHNKAGRSHETDADDKFQQFYSEADLFDRVTKYYEEDYNSPILNLVVPPEPSKAVVSTAILNESPGSASVETENLVTANDKIIEDKYRSPIVLEEFKLIFFDVPKVACSAWKLMFHRMIGEPMGDDYYYEDLYDPDRNKLSYLRDYNLTYASEIMQDPTWMRAIFVRNPHERYLSAYLDKGLSHDANYVHQQCCPHHRNCFNAPNNSFSDWVELTAGPKHCEDGHWEPYTHRIDAKYWQHMNFVGQMEPETLQGDAKVLLEKVGAWEEFGSHGWGDDGTSAFFDSHNKAGRSHGTDADDKFRQFYSEGDLFDRVTKYYEEDYNSPILNLVVPPEPSRR